MQILTMDDDVVYLEEALGHQLALFKLSKERLLNRYYEYIYWLTSSIACWPWSSWWWWHN